MADLSPRLSIPCLYNLKPAQPKNIDIEKQTVAVSPVSTMQTPIDDEKHAAVISPVEKARAAYFPDDKIAMPIGEGMEAYHGKAALEVVPQYAPTKPPERPPPPPFWKRHLLWILAGAVMLVILISVLIGLVAASHMSTNKTPVVTNNTMNSVASSGLFLAGGATWNMHAFSQNTTGGINLQVSLDGKTFQPARHVALTIPPKIGSPLSATSEIIDGTGVVMINLFYISGTNNISMSAIACASGSANCNTISNCFLPTDIPVNNNTGLAAVNVNNNQDWRVYYHDNKGFISELKGNSSGFDMGVRIGGSGLNASSIATVNVNSTTNNINLFFIDHVSQELLNMQFTGTWTTPRPISSTAFSAWNPLSGLAAAYSSVQDQLHVYLTGLDTTIYEYIGSQASKTTNTTWSALPSTQRIWADADYVGADITAVGWKDQIRFFQMSEGKMVMGQLNSRTWTESFIA